MLVAAAAARSGTNWGEILHEVRTNGGVAWRGDDDEQAWPNAKISGKVVKSSHCAHFSSTHRIGPISPTVPVRGKTIHGVLEGASSVGTLEYYLGSARTEHNKGKIS